WSTSKTPSYTKSVSWQHHQKSVISCVSDNKHSFKTFRNNQNTGIPLVNIFTYEMNKYWNI
ncbi:hypothetical protein LJD76_12460, partial [Escherichia coli]